MRKLLLISLLFIASCATMRQGIVDISNEEAENVKVMREIAEQCVKDWPVVSGFIRGLIRINELSNDNISALGRMDEIAAQTEPTDYELGEFLGLKAQMIGSVVQIIIEKYAPNAIEFLPLIF